MPFSLSVSPMHRALMSDKPFVPSSRVSKVLLWVRAVEREFLLSYWNVDLTYQSHVVMKMGRTNSAMSTSALKLGTHQSNRLS